MKGILIVRKYRNRRLYDTERSTHVTREELLEIIRKGRDVQVQEADTGNDVTSETLLQLMLSENGFAAQQIPPSFLFFLLRADAPVLARFFTEFMPMALPQFDSFLKVYRQQQESLYRGMMGWMNPWFAGAPPSPAAPPPPPEPDPGDLAQRLKDLEREIERLKKKK